MSEACRFLIGHLAVFDGRSAECKQWYSDRCGFLFFDLVSSNPNDLLQEIDKTIFIVIGQFLKLLFGFWEPLFAILLNGSFNRLFISAYFSQSLSQHPYALYRLLSPRFPRTSMHPPLKFASFWYTGNWVPRVPLIWAKPATTRLLMIHCIAHSDLLSFRALSL